MEKFRTEIKGIRSLIVIGLLVASLVLAAALPALSQNDDVCIVYDDHGNCTLWLSDALNELGLDGAQIGND